MPKTSTFPDKLCRAHKHVVSPLSISWFRPNSTCQLTLKCHNHWDVFLRLRCPGRKEKREDDGHVITSLSSRFGLIGTCSARLQELVLMEGYPETPGRLLTGTPENWVRLGLGSAPSPSARALVPMQVLVEEGDQASGLWWRPKPKPVPQPSHGTHFQLEFVCSLLEHS